MPNTFTQIRIQLIFAVKGRDKLIPKQHKNQVEKYISGVIQKRNHKVLAIFCMPDHLHILIRWHPAQSMSKLVEETKKASRIFIKEQSWMPFDFEWQRGYGAFSYSKSQTDAVVKYILDQEEHHRTRTFQEEYIDILTKLKIEFEDQYLFEFYND
jgi:putative transposase